MYNKTINITALIVTFALTASMFAGCAKANSFDALFYRDIKEIKVSVRISKYQTNIIESLIDGEKDDYGLPLAHEDVLSIIETIFKEEINTAGPIEIVATRSPPDLKSGDDQLSIFFRLEYWDRDKFSPKLNHGVIVASYERKRLVTRYRGGEDGKTTVLEERITFPLFMISVPDDRAKLRKNFEKEMRKAARKYITPYINCANGGSCKGI